MSIFTFLSETLDTTNVASTASNGFVIIYTLSGRLVCLQWPTLQILWERKVLPAGWSKSINVIGSTHIDRWATLAPAAAPTHSTLTPSWKNATWCRQTSMHDTSDRSPSLLLDGVNYVEMEKLSHQMAMIPLKCTQQTLVTLSLCDGDGETEGFCGHSMVVEESNEFKASSFYEVNGSSHPPTDRKFFSSFPNDDLHLTFESEHNKFATCIDGWAKVQLHSCVIRAAYMTAALPHDSQQSGTDSEDDTIAPLFSSTDCSPTGVNVSHDDISAVRCFPDNNRVLQAFVVYRKQQEWRIHILPIHCHSTTMVSLFPAARKGHSPREVVLCPPTPEIDEEDDHTVILYECARSNRELPLSSHQSYASVYGAYNSVSLLADRDVHSLSGPRWSTGSRTVHGMSLGVSETALSKHPHLGPPTVSSFFEANFEPLRILGRGGCGVVILVRHRMSQKLFAIKLMLVSDYATERDVLQEVQVQAGLDSKYLIQYHFSWSEIVSTERAQQLMSIGFGYQSEDEEPSPRDSYARQKSGRSKRRNPHDQTAPPTPSSWAFLMKPRSGEVPSKLLLDDPGSMGSSVVDLESSGMDSDDDSTTTSSCSMMSSYSSSTRDSKDDLMNSRIVFVQMQLSPITLGDRLSSRHFIDRLENLVILIQLCSGLNYLHGHGILHRDVKPTNTFLDYSCRCCPNESSSDDDDDVEGDKDALNSTQMMGSDRSSSLESPTFVYGGDRGMRRSSFTPDSSALCGSLTCLPNFAHFSTPTIDGMSSSFSQIPQPAPTSPWGVSSPFPFSAAHSPLPSEEMLNLIQRIPEGDSVTYIQCRSAELLMRGRNKLRGSESNPGRLLAGWLLRNLIRVRVGDFGLAKLHAQQRFYSDVNADVCGFREPHTFSPHTSNTQGVGSPLYASPEQLRGNICTTASDLFSVGIMMAEMYLLPTTVSERLNVLDRTRSGSYPTPDVLEKYPELHVVSLLTDPNPQKRGTAKQLKRYLYLMLVRHLNELRPK